MFHQALGKRNSASVAAVAAVAAAAAGAHEPEAEHPPLQQQQQQQRIVAPLLCATCHKHRTVCIAGGEGAPLSAAEAESEAALASTAAAAATSGDADSSTTTATAGAAAGAAAAATGQQHVRQANGQPNKQLYAMLEDALRQANSTELHWGFSFGGHSSAATAESAFAAAAAAAENVHSAHSAAAAVDVPVAPVPFFPGAFGSLPEAYVGRGRWFAKRVPRGGVLITFLPAFADWCELSSSSSSGCSSSSRIDEALNCAAHVQDDSDVAQIEDDELEGRQRQRSNSMPAQDMPPQHQHQQQQQYAAARSSTTAAAATSSIDDRTTSSGSGSTATTTGCASGGVLSQQALHVFAFLVRAADFKPRTQALGELHAVRSILLANLPAQLQQQQRHRDVTAAAQQQAQQQQHRRADSSSSSSDSSQSDGGQYKQQLLSLHARNFARAAYTALRQGGTLCGQDLSAALSVCSQSATKVDVTLLRRIKLAAQAQQLQLSPGRATANTSAKSNASSSSSSSSSSVAVRLDRCDEDFATTMAEYFRPVPGTDLYIYWTDERAVFSAAAEQEEVAAAQIAAEEEEEDEQACIVHVHISYIFTSSRMCLQC
jgi:hypothetical protein